MGPLDLDGTRPSERSSRPIPGDLAVLSSLMPRKSHLHGAKLAPRIRLGSEQAGLTPPSA